MKKLLLSLTVGSSLISSVSNFVYQNNQNIINTEKLTTDSIKLPVYDHKKETFVYSGWTAVWNTKQYSLEWNLTTIAGFKNIDEVLAKYKTIKAHGSQAHLYREDNYGSHRYRQHISLNLSNIKTYPNLKFQRVQDYGFWAGLAYHSAYLDIALSYRNVNNSLILRLVVEMGGLGRASTSSGIVDFYMSDNWEFLS